MAHTNQTPNYNLSEFIGSDKPSWLVDYNGDMEKIDLGLKAAKDVADAAKEEADQGAIDIAAVTLTANSADAKASGAISDISDVYDATSTYNVGDLVIYSNILYRCITNITVPEAFDGTHWARTTVEEISNEIKSDLVQLTNDFNNKIVIELRTISSDAAGYFEISNMAGYRLINISNDDGYSGEKFGYSSATGRPHGYLYQWSNLKANAQNISVLCIFIKR